MNHSSAATATSSNAIEATLPGMPNGRRRHIHWYTRHPPNDAGGPAERAVVWSSRAWTIMRWELLHFGLHVVSVSMAASGGAPGSSGVGAITSIECGVTISLIVTWYTYHDVRVSTTMASPGWTRCRSQNIPGSRCPATLKLPNSPGIAVAG